MATYYDEWILKMNIAAGTTPKTSPLGTPTESTYKQLAARDKLIQQKFRNIADMSAERLDLQRSGKKGDKGLAKELSDAITLERARIADLKSGNIALRENIKDARRFKGENLSVMFLAMQAQRAVQGMLQPAMEAAGIMELIGAIFELLFLPAMLLLIDPLVWVLDIVSGLPDSLKIVIGLFTLISGIILGLISFAAQLEIFFGTGKLAIILANIITWITSTFIPGIITTLGGASIAVIALIVLLIASILLNFNGFVTLITHLIDNFFTGITKLFQGFWDIITGVIQLAVAIIKGILTGNFDDIAKAIDKIVSGIAKAIEGVYYLTIKPVIDLFVDAFSMVAGAINNVLTMLGIKSSNSTGGSDWIPGFHLFADGGIVNKPTLGMVGEAGPEAIIPLNQIGSVGNNTIIINANMSSSLDVREVAREVNSYLVDDYKRATM